MLIYRKLVLFCLLLTAGSAMAQQKLKFSVASFEADPFDMTAQNEQYEKMDGNGSLYAIIKVTSNNPDDQLKAYNFNFGNLRSIVEQHDQELWVYVQRNAKMVTISRQGYVTVSRYDLKTTIEEGKVYVMKLSPKAEKIYTQMVMFSVEPKDCKAMVMVKATNSTAAEEDVLGITDESGSIAKSLPFGNYTYRVVAEGYYSSKGQFTLRDVAETLKETVTLKPKFATIVLRVNAQADIYVNGELKGRSMWKGRLNSGSYQVECRMDNHRNSLQDITIEDNTDKTFYLTAPVPITGMLAVVTQPLGATFSVDGEKIGSTPQQIPNLLIGEHSITLRKEGYEELTQAFYVKENETISLNLTMRKTPDNAVKTNELQSRNETDLTFRVKDVEFVMKKVDRGTYPFFADSIKSTPVTLTKDYWIGETEVTQDLWYAVMGELPERVNTAIGKGEKYPVYWISWDDCQEFIKKLNKLTKNRFRLPTSAEWKIAALGGKYTKRYRYAGSKLIDEIAWYAENSCRAVHEVKGKKANELGIYDMSGNVAEWCYDYGEKGRGYGGTDPTGPVSGTRRIYRGGGWNQNASFCTTSYVGWMNPSNKSVALGLRLAISEIAQKD